MATLENEGVLDNVAMGYFIEFVTISLDISVDAFDITVWIHR